MNELSRSLGFCGSTVYHLGWILPLQLPIGSVSMDRNDIKSKMVIAFYWIKVLYNEIFLIHTETKLRGVPLGTQKDLKTLQERYSVRPVINSLQLK